MDWGYYAEINGMLKSVCAMRCKNDDNCGTFEWTNQHCIWWKKGMCQLSKTTNAGFTGSIATCKKLGIFKTLNHYIWSILIIRCGLIHFLVSLEFGFRKVDNTNCIPRGDEFVTLEDAENECKNRKQCKGVLDIDCNGQQNYTICLNTAATSSDDKIESCLYKKYNIGKPDMDVDVIFLPIIIYIDCLLP